MCAPTGSFIAPRHKFLCEGTAAFKPQRNRKERGVTHCSIVSCSHEQLGASLRTSGLRMLARCGARVCKWAGPPVTFSPNKSPVLRTALALSVLFSTPW